MNIFLEITGFDGEILNFDWFPASITQEELAELYPDAVCFNIIDWEGFGPISANRHTLEEINKICSIVESDGLAPLIYMDLFESDPDLIEDWEDKFVGCYSDKDQFIEDYLDIYHSGLPYIILSNLDYDSFWEDIRHDYLADEYDDKFYVFYA